MSTSSAPKNVPKLLAKHRLTIWIVQALVLVALGFYIARNLNSSSSSQSESEVAVSQVAAGPSMWTCSMHPQIQQPRPGKCPICGMDLIPLEQDGAGDEGPRTMSMSESSRAPTRARVRSLSTM